MNKSQLRGTLCISMAIQVCVVFDVTKARDRVWEEDNPSIQERRSRPICE